MVARLAAAKEKTTIQISGDSTTIQSSSDNEFIGDINEDPQPLHKTEDAIMIISERVPV